MQRLIKCLKNKSYEFFLSRNAMQAIQTYLDLNLLGMPSQIILVGRQFNKTVDKTKEYKTKRPVAMKPGYARTSVTRWINYFSIIGHNENVPKSIRYLPKQAHKFANYIIVTQEMAKLFLNLAQVAKFRQICSHWHVRK